MKVVVSLETKRLIKDLLGGLSALVSQASKEYAILRVPQGSQKPKLCEELASALYMQWTQDGKFDDTENGGFLAGYSDLLAQSCIVAYLGLFDNDKNLDKLREARHDELVKELLSKRTDTDNKDLTEEEEKNISDTIKKSFDFGYESLFSVVQGCIECIENNESSDSFVKDRVESNLLSSERNISYEEYLTGGYIDNDVKLIATMGNKEKEELVEAVVNIIKGDTFYSNNMSDVKVSISATYQYFFQDSFGLRPYEGVVTLDSKTIKVIDRSNRVADLKNAKGIFSKISTQLKQIFNVKEIDTRQFDIDAIISSKSDDVPLYFPYKILEYAKGREITYNLTENFYRKHSKSSSWESYFTNYVSPQLDRYILETVYKTIEKNVTKEDLKKLKGYTVLEEDENKPFSFASDSFQQYYKPTEFNDIQEDLEDFICDEKYLDLVNESLTKLMKALCSGVAVTSYSKLGTNLVKIGIRVVDTAGTLSATDTKTLFSKLIINKGEHFEDAVVITDGKTTSKGSSLPFKIYDFKHDFNSALAEAEPMFAYTAVEMFLEQGRVIDWNKLLIGEDLNGTPLFAGKDKDDIHMQSNTVHNIVAGSRSGKGLLTMTLLASAVTSGKAVFYIDRKPDMALTLYDMTKGNMFVCNGGATEPENKHLFESPSGEAIKGWKTGYDNAPDYVKQNMFKNKDTYVRSDNNLSFGDMVYYRAMMLILGIIFARSKATKNPDVYEKLGGSAGLAIVIDEFTNWNKAFGMEFGITGKIAKDAYLLDDKKEKGNNVFAKFKKANDKIKEAKMDLADLDPEKDKAKIRKLESTINKVNEELSTYTPWGAYCACLIEAVKSTNDLLQSNLNASFHGTKEEETTDIFVISQRLEKPMNSTDMYVTTVDGTKFDESIEDKTATPFRTFFLRGFHDIDYFIGKEASNFVGLDSVASIRSLLDEKSRWAYIDSVAYDSLTDTKSVQSHTKLFKPYLVLNKNNEDDPENPAKYREEVNGQVVETEDTDYKYVTQCRKRCNEASPDMWENIRLKHLGNKRLDPEGYDLMLDEAISGTNKHYGELNDGIGLKGLAALTKETQHSLPDYKPFDPLTDLGKSKQIADFVAQKLGYTDYKDYLFDMTPQGIYSAQDIASIVGEGKPDDIYIRLEPFFHFGFMSDDSMTSEPENGTARKNMNTDTEKLMKRMIEREEKVSTEQDKSESLTSSISESTPEPIPESTSEDEILTADVKEAMERSNADDGLGAKVVPLEPDNTASQDAILTDDVKEAMERSNADVTVATDSEDLTEDNTKLYLTKNDLIATYMFDLMEQIESATLEQKGPMPVAFYRQILNTMKEKDSFIDALLDCARDDNPDVEVILND